MTASVSVGEVWVLNGARSVVVVVFVSPEEHDGEDIRVIPLYIGPVYTAIASSRDVVIPAEHNSLHRPLLATTWNARALARMDLAICRGTVSAEALKVLRDVEMSGILPGKEALHTEWRGAPFASLSDHRLTAHREMLREWDDLHARLVQFRGAMRRVLKKEQYSARTMRGGTGALDVSLCEATLGPDSRFDEPLGAYPVDEMPKCKFG